MLVSFASVPSSAACKMTDQISQKLSEHAEIIRACSQRDDHRMDAKDHHCCGPAAAKKVSELISTPRLAVAAQENSRGLKHE